MSPVNSKKSIHDLINKERWRQILQRFIEVLNINIFIVDSEGRPYLTPTMGKYGWKLLSHTAVGVDMFGEHSNSLLDKFKKQGFYLEYHYPFMLHSFAVPMDLENGKTIAYLIIGPVILNKRLENEEYEKIAKTLNLDFQSLMDSINEIRVVSFISLNSILDLLYEVSKYTLQLSDNVNLEKEGLPKRLTEMIKKVSVPASLDELLVSLLDLALSLTKTECGSVMILDDRSGDLIIRVSRGIDQKIAKKTRLKLGEGIAGLAAKERTSFLINGNQCDSRIKPFLKRPEIQRSLISPLCLEDEVFGVLNLHSMQETDSETAEKLLPKSLETLRQLSRVASIAVSNFR